jgi:hypothetical protein
MTTTKNDLLDELDVLEGRMEELLTQRDRARDELATHCPVKVGDVHTLQNCYPVGQRMRVLSVRTNRQLGGDMWELRGVSVKKDGTDGTTFRFETLPITRLES